MAILRAKAFFTVTAGIIPGTVDPQYTKHWNYTDLDYEDDVRAVQDPAPAPSKFMVMRDAAHEYARSITDPRAVNWVRVDFMWV
jgi:hypothetical protein